MQENYFALNALLLYGAQQGGHNLQISGAISRVYTHGQIVIQCITGFDYFANDATEQCCRNIIDAIESHVF